MFNFIKKTQKEMLEDALRVANAQEDIEWSQKIDRKHKENFDRFSNFGSGDSFF